MNACDSVGSVLCALSNQGHINIEQRTMKYSFFLLKIIKFKIV